jgi:hypothetical protein
MSVEYYLASVIHFIRSYIMKSNPNYRPDSVYTSLRAKLFGRGLFEDQADAILASLVNQKDHVMSGRWNDRADGYPGLMIAALWMDAKAAALEWIDKNAPCHWARPMFMPDVGKTIQKMETADTDPKIKPVGDRLKEATRLFLDRPQSPAGVMVATRRLRTRQKAFDRLDIAKS